MILYFFGGYYAVATFAVVVLILLAPVGLDRLRKVPRP